MTETILLAMDRASVRSIDANGFMHVEVSNISKANVCPYLGNEIPGWRDLGLDAERVYHLYRAPEELAAAALTFNNLPLLSKHMPVMPENLPEDLIIGSTGTDAAFDGIYLKNSLVVWSGTYQMAIEAERQRELSCGYFYTPDMTPGTTKDGLQYDGVMRSIVGNHVALVIEGRAGPDVLVGDEVMLKSRTALMISGAVQAVVRPLLAADAKVDIGPALEGVDAKLMAADGAPKSLASKIARLVKPALAADKAVDLDALISAISAVKPLAPDEDKIEDAEDEDEEDDKDKVAEDEDGDEDDKKAAEDEDGDDDQGDKQAMDAAAVRRMVAAAEARGERRAAALDAAKHEVEPLVGKLIGMDSARTVYRTALKAQGYEVAALDGAPLATLKAMVAREVASKSAARKSPIAVDHAAAKAANDTFVELYGSN
jgi:hypothetical protein